MATVVAVVVAMAAAESRSALAALLLLNLVILDLLSETFSARSSATPMLGCVNEY